MQAGPRSLSQIDSISVIGPLTNIRAKREEAFQE